MRNSDPNPPRKSWFDHLSADEVRFIKRFLLSSGSLKALAKIYQVSYPTIRNRLDAVIARVEQIEDSQPDTPFHRKVRELVRKEKLSITAAQQLLEAYETERDVD